MAASHDDWNGKLIENQITKKSKVPLEVGEKTEQLIIDHHFITLTEEEQADRGHSL
jgi:hypothetical protein